MFKTNTVIPTVLVATQNRGLVSLPEEVCQFVTHKLAYFDCVYYSYYKPTCNVPQWACPLSSSAISALVL